MNNGGRSAGAAAAIFDDCYFLACDFPTSRFEHCNREANKVAHELARLARFLLPLIGLRSLCLRLYHSSQTMYLLFSLNKVHLFFLS